MKVMHVLNTNNFSGAENVVCQIINLFENKSDFDMVYCSPDGEIRDALKERNITFFSINKLNKKQLKRAIREVKPDIIHAHDMRASFIASLVCGKIPLVSHIHNNAFDSRGISLKSIAYIYAGIKAKHIFWVSKSSFEGYQFHRLFKKKSSILYNIINIDTFLKRVELDKNNYYYDIIFLGRLSFEKNPLRFIDICKILVERKKDIKIAIVGDGNLREDVLSKINEYHLFDNVNILGFLSNPTKVLQDSKIMVMTSLWEGTPMSALEAGILGVPIVSTPVDGLKDLIENDVTGYLCDDNIQMADKIIYYLDNPQILEQLSINQINKAKQWNDGTVYMENVAREYQRISK